MELTEARSERNRGIIVRRLSLYGVMGQLGMWDVIINDVQASITEHNKMGTVAWSGCNSLSLCSRVGFASSRKVHHSWSLDRLHSWCGHRSYVDFNILTSPP